MKEETDLGLWNLLANHSRNKKQMVIVNPDNITSLPVLDNLVGKGLVHVDVVLPRVILVCLALGVVGDLVMEDGPEDVLAEVGVVSVEILVRAENCQHVVLSSQNILNILLLRGTLKSISRHAKSTNPCNLINLAITSSGVSSIAKTTVTLISIHNHPTSRSKDSVMAVASDKRSRLQNTLTS